jgi:hypothetical protein
MKPLTVRLLVTSLALAFAGAAHSAEPVRNVFAPAQQVTATAPVSDVVTVGAPNGASTTAVSAPRLVLPPPIPVLDNVRLPPVLPPPPVPAADALQQPGPTARSIADNPEKHNFLTREQLKERRDGCDVARKGPEKSTVSLDGGQLTVRYTLTGGRGCLSAAGADSDWASVSRWDNGEAIIQVDPNDSGVSRETVVTLTTAAGKRATYVISQPGEAGPIRAVRNRGSKQ